MGLFLNQSELIELTGYRFASFQVRWLLANGYMVETNARGIPRITYLQVEEKRRPGHLLPFGHHKQQTAEPNLAALQNKIGNIHG